MFGTLCTTKETIYLDAHLLMLGMELWMKLEK